MAIIKSMIDLQQFCLKIIQKVEELDAKFVISYSFILREINR